MHAGRDPARGRRGGTAAVHCGLPRTVEGDAHERERIPGSRRRPSSSRAARRWTAREIAQQPEVWTAVGELVARERAGLDAFLQPLIANPHLRIVLTGAGTSAYIGDCLAPALSARLRRRVEAIATTDLLSGPDLRLPADGPDAARVVRALRQQP